MKIDVFAYDSYRELLRQQAKNGAWGSITKLAQAIRVERSHFSRVLNGTKHLSPEQALGLASHRRFTDAETEYFLMLVNRDRAGTQALRERLSRQLKRMKLEQDHLKRRLSETETVATDKELTYFSSWYWSAVHMALSLPKMNTSAAIAQRLQLPPALVEFVLSALERFGFARQEKSKWFPGSGSLHLPKHSPLVGLHHQNWRQRAVLDAQQPESEGVHYTVVQSISRRDFERLKEEVYRLINQYTAIAEPSPPEELIAFHCDFYRV